MDDQWYTWKTSKVLGSRASRNLLKGTEDSVNYEKLWKKSQEYIQNDVIRTEYSLRVFSQGLEIGEQGDYKKIQERVYNSLRREYNSQIS